MSQTVNKEFAVHKLNDRGVIEAIKIAQTFDQCLQELLLVCPEPSREMSLCRTKLEEAAFFCKKAMAQMPVNGEPR